MTKKWMRLEWADCPNCGNALEAHTDTYNEGKHGADYVNDGDDVRCSEGCGFKSCTNVDEDHAWVQEGNLDEL